MFLVTQAAYALSATIMLMHVPPSVFLELKHLYELANRGSTSRGVNKSTEVGRDVLIGESKLILNTLNVG